MPMPDPPRLLRLAELSPSDLERLGVTRDQAARLDALFFEMLSVTTTMVDAVTGMLSQAVDLAVNAAMYAQAPVWALSGVLAQKGVLESEDVEALRRQARKELAEIAAGRAVDLALGDGPSHQLKQALAEFKEWSRQLGEKNRRPQA